MPIATIVNLTATGDVITGPGCPTKIFMGLPVACMGDLVAGALCVSGAITVSTAINKIFMGRPAANMTSVVAGVSPIGVPVATAVMVCQNINKLY
jgi:uncharacterized Zn-binding protein involved in type VI secretion